MPTLSSRSVRRFFFWAFSPIRLSSFFCLETRNPCCSATLRLSSSFSLLNSEMRTAQFSSSVLKDFGLLKSPDAAYREPTPFRGAQPLRRFLSQHLFEAVSFGNMVHQKQRDVVQVGIDAVPFGNSRRKAGEQSPKTASSLCSLHASTTCQDILFLARSGLKGVQIFFLTGLKRGDPLVQFLFPAPENRQFRLCVLDFLLNRCGLITPFRTFLAQ